MADGRLHTVITADNKPFDKGIEEVERKLDHAEKKTKEFGNSLDKSTKSLGASLGQLAGRYLSVAAAVGVLTTAIKKAIELNANFERKNAELASVLGTTKDGVKDLSVEAERLGRVTEFTATEVTELQLALARLGFTKGQIIDMQGTILQFAAAVNADLGRAANFAGAALRGFGLEAKDTGHLLDVMAAATSKSALDFSKLETSISIVAPIAHTFGLSVEDTVTLLGALSNAGFDASSAATATRNILLNLADANGKLAKGLGHTANTFPEIIASLKECQQKGVDLNATLEMTDKRSVAAFNALITGAASADELRTALGNVDGTLTQMYDTMTNNLIGATRELKSAWEGLMLKFQESNGPLADTARWLAKILNYTTDFIESSNTGGKTRKQKEFDADLLNRFREYEELYGTEAMQKQFLQWEKDAEAAYDRAIDTYNAHKTRKNKKAMYEAGNYALALSDMKPTIMGWNKETATTTPEPTTTTPTKVLTEEEKKEMARYAKAFEKAVRDMWKSVDSAYLDSLKEGAFKRLEQIRLEEKAALAAIEEEKKTLEEAAKKGGKTIDPKVYKDFEKREEYVRKSAQNKREQLLEEQMQNEWEYLRDYGTAKEKELAITQQYDAAIAKEDDEFKKKRLQREKEDALAGLKSTRLEYLKEYGTLKEREAAISEEYDEKIAQTTDEWLKKSLQKQKEAALRELNSTFGEIYKLVAKDVSKMGIFTINKAIADAEAEIARLSADPTKVEENAQAIEYLRQAIERLKKASSDFSATGLLKMLFEANKDGNGAGMGIAERFKAIKEAWNNMSSEEKWKQIGDWVSGIADGLSKAADCMREVAELGGDSALADTADQLSAVAQNLSAAGGGAATGGWIGAIVGGVVDILGQTIEAFANVAKQEAIAAANARDYRMEIVKLAIAVNEADFDSVFGDMKIARGRAYAKNAGDSAALYEKKLDELNSKYNNQHFYSRWKDTDKFTGWDLFLPIIGSIGYRASQMDVEANDWRAYQDAMNKGYEGLQRMLVTTKKQTGWAKFWGAQDEYKSLGDLAPDMWDENGELNVDAAKAFLETNTQITDEQRKQIENLVEIKEGYDKAMQEIDNAISDTFGNLAESLSDIIWDSVVNGGDDAWEQFQKVGSEAISKLGKQLISEMLMSEYLEQFRERMRSAYKMGSSAETQAELRSIVGDIFGGMGAMLEAGSAVAEEYKKWAEEHGFDLSDNSAEKRTGATKTAVGASQDSVDESNARLTTIQGHTYELNENVKRMRQIQSTLTTMAASILNHVMGIHKDTTGINDKTDDIKKEVSALRTEVSRMNTNGITIKR